MVGPGNNGAPVEAHHRVKGECGSALQPRVLWEGNRREAKVSTGLGKAHRPGSRRGPAETWTMVELGPHLAYRKSECWKLSA